VGRKKIPDPLDHLEVGEFVGTAEGDFLVGKMPVRFQEIMKLLLRYPRAKDHDLVVLPEPFRKFLEIVQRIGLLGLVEAAFAGAFEDFGGEVLNSQIWFLNRDSDNSDKFLILEFPPKYSTLFLFKFAEINKTDEQFRSKSRSHALR
jgi:hypothetical protein